VWDRLTGWSKSWQQAVPAIAGFVVVGIICYSIYVAASVFTSLAKELKVALIAGIAAFGVAMTTNYVQKKREMDFKIREKN
jgi:putative flippase GtrA